MFCPHVYLFRPLLTTMTQEKLIGFDDRLAFPSISASVAELCQTTAQIQPSDFTLSFGIPKGPSDICPCACTLPIKG